MIWDNNNHAGQRMGQQLLGMAVTNPGEWSVAYTSAGVAVLHARAKSGIGSVHQLQRAAGVVVGTLFDREHCNEHKRQDEQFGDDETDRILRTEGHFLIDRYWGAYWALIICKQSSSFHVLRDPTGMMPCFHASAEGVSIFFSHVGDCAGMPWAHFAINRDYIARWLLASRLVRRETGLNGVTELVGGERVTLHGREISRTSLWNPAMLAIQAPLCSPNEAATQLREIVTSSITAWCSCYQRIGHKLSGGLDSSIVAGCIAGAPSRPHVTYLNFSTDPPSSADRMHFPGLDDRSVAKLRSISGHGDERYFARLVAERWQRPLVERQRVQSLDLRRLWLAPLMTSPAMFFTSMEVDDTEIELTRSRGIQAFFSGQAGDSAFLATSQPLAAIDFVLERGIKRGLWQHIVATAELAKESVWSVLGGVIKHGVFHQPYRNQFEILKQATLLKSDVLRGYSEYDFLGPRAEMASSLPPGKRAHVAGLDGSAHYDYVFHSYSYADHIDPLNSQPVWEVLLRIPTYVLLAGGISRGLTRSAFADILPAEIRRRQVKGSGTPFYQNLVRSNRSYLREFLLNGRLVSDGYLDREKTEACLTAEEPSLLVSAADILTYLAAEIWIQEWTQARKSAAA